MPYDHLIELLDFVEKSRPEKLPDEQRPQAARKGKKTAYRQPAASRSNKSKAKTKAAKKGVRKQ